jgi:hypothetical protein
MTRADRPVIPAAAKLTRFEWVVAGLLALGAVAVIEPAPFDLLVVVIAPLALFARQLAVPRASSFALACVGVFLLTNAISLLAAPNLALALRFGGITVYLIVAWALVLGLVGKHGVRMVEVMMRGWSVGAVASTLVGFAGYFGLLPIQEIVAPSGRLHGLFKDANVLGAFLVPPAVWAGLRLVALERGRRLPWALTLLVCGAGVFLTYSRGAWISLALALATAFGLRMVGAGTPRARIMTLLAVPVAVALLAVVLVRLTEVDAVREMLEIRVGMQSYDSERFAIQRRSIELALRTPLGIGPGQTEGVIGRASHQTYVRGFVENGYLGGLALVALMLGSLLRASWVAISAREPRLQVAATMIAASLAAICVESLVIDSVHWRHMWLVLAMAWVPAQGAARGAARGPTRGS